MRVKSQNSQSIAVTHPQLVSEWHPTLNGELTPEMFSAGSTKKKIWWLGTCGHEWLAIVYNRARGRGCHICAGHKILIGFNDLFTSDPDVAAQWHPTLNGELTPEMVSKGNSTKVWWLGECGHEWKAVVCDRSIKKLGCPYCANRKILVGYNDFATTHPDIAAQWHPTLNGELTPEMVTAGNSGNKVWWLGKCGHEWDTDVKTRARHKSGCPYCSGHKIQAGFNDLATVCPQLASEWHPSKNGAVTPHMIGRGSEQKVWWICKEGHEWKAIIKTRLGKLSRECPYCAGTLTLIGLNDLFTTRPHLAAEWHPTKNAGVDPQKLRAGNTTQKVWWLCPKGHEWSAKVADRARPDGKANNCPTCAASIFISRGEQEIADYLTKELGLTITQSNRRLLKGMEIDIYVPEKQLAIEYNGVYWHSTAMQSDHQYHQKKYELAQAAGIQLIQIWEDEWANKPELVKRLLAHKLGESREPLIGARQTHVEAIPLAEARVFLNEHHIQGHANGSHYLGLRSKASELVAVMVLVKRSAQNNALDIVRYATSHRVPGGFTKLLKHVEQVLHPSRLVTFADHCISDGGLYAQNGFMAEKELKPDYRYLVNKQRAHKFGYRLARFKADPSLLWEPNLTETQLAALNGLHRVYDAGKTRWTKDLLTD